MADEARKTGIGIIGDVPWGTHFCHFYRTKEDLINVLVPYFKAGLENNEFCLWATSEPLGAEEAHKAMEKAMPGFARYVESGRIDIVPHDQWYLQDGLFESERVIRAWIDKLDRALAAGRSGMRASGNTSWLERKDWESFAAYEAAINRVIGKYRMLVLCAYWLENISAADVFEVAGSHTFAVVGRNGDLELVEGALYRKKAEETLRESEKKHRQLIETIDEGVWVIDKHAGTTFVNARMAEMLGYSVEEMMGKSLFSLVMNERDVEFGERKLETRRRGIKEQYEVEAIRKDGTSIHMSVCASPILDDEGQYAGSIAGVQDITNRKRAEEALKASEGRFKGLFEHMASGVAVYEAVHNGEDFILRDFNPAAEKISKVGREDVLGRRVTEAFPGIKGSGILDMFRRVWRTGRAEFSPEAIYRDERNPGGWRENWVYKLPSGEVVAVYNDITERKRAEKALQESEEKHRTLFETMAQGVTYQDSDGRIVSANPAAERILGLTFGQMQGRTSIDPRWRAVNEDGSDFPGETHPAMVSLRTGESVNDIVMGVFNPIEEGYRWISINAIPQFKPGEDRPYQVYTTFDDITDRKQAEEALKKSHQLLNDTGEMAKVGGWELDLSTNEVKLTEEVCRIHGLEPGHRPKLEEALSFYAPESRSAVEAVVKKAAETGEPYDLESLFIPRGSKEKIWVRSLGKAVYSGGEIVKLVGTFQNIDEYKRAEDALRESEAQYRTLFDAMPVAVIITTPEGKVVSVNNAIKAVSGYTPEEFMAMSMADLYVDPGERKRLLALLQEDGKVSDFEVMSRQKDGLNACVLLNVEDFELRGRKLIMTTVRDITNLKQAEIRQQQINEQLIMASRLASLGLLASGVAHEINNPLAVVMGCAQLVLEKDPPEEVKEDLRLINDSAQQMAEVVQRLLTFGRQSRLGKECVDINALVSRVLRLRAREMSIHNIEVTTRLDPDLPRTMADVGQMQQVFLNIIMNAEQAIAKANKDGHFLVKTKRTDDRITITFRDDGVGITKEHLPRLFDPFFTTKDVGEGMGLGLSISYGIVREHGGRIYAKGQPGKGAAFVVELPIVAKPVQPGSVEEPAEEPEEKVVGRILVVDDEPGICQLLRDLLTRDGHSVETTGDASVALEMVKHERFNLILLDIKMKGMTGIDLYQQMGRVAKSLQHRVLFITGDTMARDTRGFLDTTEAPHICKPFDIQQLRKMVNQILRSGRK